MLPIQLERGGEGRGARCGQAVPGHSCPWVSSPRGTGTWAHLEPRNRFAEAGLVGGLFWEELLLFLVCLNWFPSVVWHMQLSHSVCSTPAVLSSLFAYHLLNKKFIIFRMFQRKLCRLYHKIIHKKYFYLKSSRFVTHLWKNRSFAISWIVFSTVDWFTFGGTFHMVHHILLTC